MGLLSAKSDPFLKNKTIAFLGIVHFFLCSTHNTHTQNVMCFILALKHSKWWNNLWIVLSCFPMKIDSCWLELQRFEKFCLKKARILWLIRYQRWNIEFVVFFCSKPEVNNSMFEIITGYIKLHALNLQAIV